MAILLLRERMRLLIMIRASLFLVLAVAISCFLPGGASYQVRAATPSISVISITPKATCCRTPNNPFQVGDTFTVSVSVSISSGEAINSFDVRVNYTNPQTVLRAVSIDYSNNLFSSYPNDVPAECIDGISKLANAAACASEDLGQVHLVEAVLGTSINGPQAGTLFQITFRVIGNGTSTLLFDQANLLNPSPDPSRPQFFNPQFIPLLKKAGIFGNQGVVSFFDFQPVDTSISPSLIPNQPVTFDASASFVANNSALGLRLFSWNFGDGTRENKTAVDPHTFQNPGNYTVSLTVWDVKNETGSLSRRVSVLPALGTLSLTVEDQSGNLQRGNVIVRIFNASSSPAPFATRTTNGGGGVLVGQLTPGNYYVSFSGQGIVNSSKTENARPGWTTMDTVYLSMVSPPQDLSGLIYLGTILGGVGVVAGAIVYQKRKSSNRASKAQARGTLRTSSKNSFEF
jgi:PKD domain